jgi:dipeptidyl aminopeptidase/acylaminoacyl peptidase
MTDLRTSLQRVADAVEPLPVDDDLWQRGVAARRRGRAVVVAAVVAVVVSVAGTATLLGQEDREARTASPVVVEGGAIPRDITDIDDDLAVTSDLAVGQGSAAFRSSAGHPVVITATDGVAHRLDMPGWDQTPRTLAMSADGRRIAYQDASGETGTHVTVVDLETGRSVRVFSDDTQRLQVSELSWSPDGRWLAWIATTQDGLVALLGRVDTSDPRPRQVRLPSDAVSVAVADDGSALVGRVAGELLLAGPGGGANSVYSGPGIEAGAFSPDGLHVALRASATRTSYTWDTDAGELLEHPFPEDTLEAVDLRPLGWLDDRLQVLLAQNLRGNDGELVVTTSEVDETSTWRRSVGRVDADIAGSLTIAVDLLPDLDGTSSQQLTHDFSPGGRDISWIIGLGVAAAIAVLLALRWLWRRFRPM